MIEKNSNVPRIIDRLVTKKLVKRATSEVDRRETVISLTPSGLSLLDNSTSSINQAMEAQVSIGQREAQVLNQLLEKVRAKE